MVESDPRGERHHQRGGQRNCVEILGRRESKPAHSGEYGCCDCGPEIRNGVPACGTFAKAGWDGHRKQHLAASHVRNRKHQCSGYKTNDAKKESHDRVTTLAMARNSAAMPAGEAPWDRISATMPRSRL